MMLSDLYAVQSMQFLMRLLTSYLHLPHFLLKVQQLVLKASSNADGDLQMDKIQIDFFRTEKKRKLTASDRKRGLVLHLQAPHQLL